MKYTKVAQADSFQELAQVVPDMELPKGERVRIVMKLNMPFAKAFDLAGAEHIFRPVMPPGLTLVDVYGEGWSTAVIEGEADPVWLAAIAVFIVDNWLGLSLAAIGITVALGFLIGSVALLTTSVTAPEVIPETGKWLVLGGVGVAGVIGAAYLFSKK